MDSAKKGRMVMSVSFRPEVYETVCTFCKERNFNRSKVMEEAVLQYILQSLQREVSENEEVN